jgi:hypothetical protein
MDVPIKFNRLKKATEQPTPEEHLEPKKLPFRSLLGAVGFLMTRSISSLYWNSSLTSRSIRHRFSSVPIGGMSSLRLVMLTGTTRSFIFQLLASSCFTAAIHPISWASRTQRNTAHSVGESEFILTFLLCARATLPASAQSVHSLPFSNPPQFQVLQ